MSEIVITQSQSPAGADPGFLERGFMYIKLILSHFSQISHENEIIWSHRDQIISFS